MNKKIPAQIPESTHLLSAQSSTSNKSSQRRHRLYRRFCLPSKAAILMLFWTAIVGIIYYTVIGITATVVDYNSGSLKYSRPSGVILVYAFLAFIAMTYPLSGLIADVYCGRLKTVGISLFFLLAFTVILCVLEIFDSVYISKLHALPYYSFKEYDHNKKIVITVIGLIAFILFNIGLAGYQANFIQLGLDQLFEAPSQYLRLFILYTAWIFGCGSLPFTLMLPLLLCSVQLKDVPIYLLVIIPSIISVTLIILLIISRWKRHWFYIEPGHQNPYKTVFNVIKFAKNHKHPLRRSAFAYCDDYVPSRIDFAKQRFGGPFTTEQVENVKTFLRIVIVLLATGPLFVLEVPASLFIFPLFGFHTSKFHKHAGRDFCTGGHVIVETGSLMNLFSTLFFFPVYIWVNTSMFCRKAHGFFKRVFIGAVISLLGVTCLVITDVVGHSLKADNISNGTQCMFQVYRSHGIIYNPALNIHWSVLIPPSLLLGVGPLLVITASLEFISAQSPQPMKGFLIGIFFAIRGLFQFLNSTVTFAFSFKQPWASGEILEHPPVTNCGFTYFLFTTVTGLIGLLLFSIAAKKYKYRERDEGLFQQQVVEDIYERYITQDHSSIESFISDER